MDKPKLVIVAGPTATGKSSLAVRLCQDFNGSVINADSVQIYKHLNIGTAKPTLTDMAGVPHYLLDFLDPKEPFSVADFRAAAVEKISEIQSRGQNVFVAGGTGLYVRILTSGIIDVPGSDPKIRAELKERAESEGIKALYEELKDVDEASASKISGNDLFRIIRALEVCKVSGAKASEVRAEHAFGEEEFDTLKIGLNMDRARLYQRIEGRVDTMIGSGLEDEVRGLIEMGYSRDLKPLTSIGYKQMMMYIAGEVSREEAVRLIKRDTRRYAKRQITWFKKERGIVWFDAEDVQGGRGYAEVAELVRGFFA